MTEYLKQPLSAPTARYAAPQKSRRSLVTIILGVLFLILLIFAGIVGLSVVQNRQEVRQRASTGTTGPSCGSACNTDSDCQSGFVCGFDKTCANQLCNSFTPVFRLANAKTNDHNYTINATERDADVSTYGYTSEGSVFWAATVQTSGTVPVYRLINNALGVHFLTTQQSEVTTAKANGFTYEGIVFYAGNTHQPPGVVIPQMKGWVPVYRLYNGHDYFYTANYTEAQDAITKLKYQYQEISFLVPSQPLNSLVPVYRLSSVNDHIFTANVAEENAALGLGYKNEGISFYANNTALPGLSPVYEYTLGTGALATSRHFYSLNQNDPTVSPQAGWQQKGVAFYVSATPAPGYRPEYQLENHQINSFMYTNTIAEEQADVNQFGFTSDGTKFYVATSPSCDSNRCSVFSGNACTMYFTSTGASPTPTPSVTPIPSCEPRPACLDANPPCKIAIPLHGFCATPTPTATPSPTPVVGPVCLSIIANGQLNANNSVTFTCGTVSGATGYEFEIIKPDGTISDLSNLANTATSNGSRIVTGSSNTSLPITLTQTGQYTAKCRICTGNDETSCQPYE